MGGEIFPCAYSGQDFVVAFCFQCFVSFIYILYSHLYPLFLFCCSDSHFFFFFNSSLLLALHVLFVSLSAIFVYLPSLSGTFASLCKIQATMMLYVDICKVTREQPVFVKK